MKIDYNTANIIIPIVVNGEEKQVHVPPLNEPELRSNALVLGRYVELLDNVNPVVLLQDYEIYIEDIIEELVSKKYSNENDPYRVKYKNDLTTKVSAMLERSISGGYYLDNLELKSVESLDEEGKRILRASLLFFMVLFRYVRPTIATEDWVERMKDTKISFTSLNATEWKNTLTTPSQGQETLGL